MRRILTLLVVLASLAFAGHASAAEIVSRDHAGRPIHFDVRTEGVDVEWYAERLRNAPHGDEISRLLVIVVSSDDLRSQCGAEAAGCYSRNTMIVPAGENAETEHTLLHEYGHHLDWSHPVAGVPEPNGTPYWYTARGIDQLVRLGSITRNYSVGWDRSIAELFAEDYARLALGATDHKIDWLTEPDEVILAALKADLGLGEPPANIKPPTIKPLTIRRSGTLARRGRVVVPFGLLGPGRRVTATATVTGAAAKGTRATLEIRCDGARVALRSIGKGKTRATIDLRNVGPATCTTTLAGTGTTRRAFTLQVRLAVGSGSA